MVHVLVNGGLGARLGLALSRRSLARSVDRNLVKRIAREAFRSIATSIPSSDIVLSFRGSAKSMDRAQVGAKIVTLLRQVR